MGTFSKFHRFREAGESANVNNVERFGEPVRSLFTSTKLMTVHHRIEITDSYENVVYRDSADDGFEGEVFEPGAGTDDFELTSEAERISKRLAFLRMLAQLWRIAAGAVVEAER